MLRIVSLSKIRRSIKVKATSNGKQQIDEISPASICILNNATVIPMMQGSSPNEIKGGVIHPNMDLKFHQYRGAAINKNQKKLELVTKLDFISTFKRNFFSSRGTFVYGGPIFSNFGHFLAECIHRCWAFEFAQEHLKVKVDKVLFTPQKNRSFSSLGAQEYKLPPVYLEILNYLGIPTDKIQCVFSPKTVRNLIVPQQASMFRSNHAVTNSYLEFLDRCESKHLQTAGQQLYQKVYVSRSHFTLRGAYAGESYLETFLQKNGFHIYFPEKHSILSQLGMYKGAKEIIFAEGSALHVLELLSQVDAHISIICRRSLSVSLFKPLLTSRVKILSFMSRVETLTTLFFSKNTGKPAHGSAISVLNTDALLSFMNTAHKLDIALFDKSEYLEAVKKDLNYYLSHYTQQISEHEPKQVQAILNFKLALKNYFSS